MSPKILQFDFTEKKKAVAGEVPGQNSQRSVNTFSGGKSFMVSLALALGLSDLAGKNTRINSLFIDEGFGSLDQETLDTALSTLERLQHETNRTIGIISHVAALKERITTQIERIKDAGGRSSIEIISLCRSPGDSSPSFYAGDEAGFFA